MCCPQISRPGWVAQHLPQHTEAEGLPVGTLRVGPSPSHPIAGARKRPPAALRRLGSHNSWWQMVGQPGQTAPAAAAAKAWLVKGHRARGSMAPGRLPGDRLQEPRRREGSTLRALHDAGSCLQLAAACPAPLPPHTPRPRGSMNGQRQPQHHRGQEEWGPARLGDMQPLGICLGGVRGAGSRERSPRGQAGP